MNDRDRFADLYPELRRVASVAAPAEVDPDDLVQDALVRILRRQRKTSIDNEAAYLTTTVIRLAANERRSWLRRQKAYAAHGPAPTSDRSDYPSDLAALEHVGPKARAVLYLHDVEGRTFDEVAELVGEQPPAVRKIAERARDRLEAALREDDHAAR